jgi:hypothetical protein
VSVRWRVLAAAMALAGAVQAAEMVTAVIPAGFRSADELAHILRPLIPAPGSVNGFHNQLVIKTTPDNLAELRQILATLDTAPANLLVTVRHTLDAEVSRDLAQAAARIGSARSAPGSGPDAGGVGVAARSADEHASAALRLQRHTRTREGTDVQTLRVLEGKEAFIHSGESVPAPERNIVISGAAVSIAEGTRYDDYGTGFYVRPRLAGDSVVLDIIPSRRERRGDGSAAVREASTSVSGALGRWIAIATADAQSADRRSGIASSRRSSTRRNDAIYVKVQRLD